MTKAYGRYRRTVAAHTERRTRSKGVCYRVHDWSRETSETKNVKALVFGFFNSKRTRLYTQQ